MPLLSIIIPVWNETLLEAGGVASASVISACRKHFEAIHRCGSARCNRDLRERGDAVMPHMHGIHHSVKPQEMNANFSSGLTVRDVLREP
jgi:sterol desaturase/sphingolipid hydroxylase (fatty acid hydroxylase superfamily)